MEPGATSGPSNLPLLPPNLLHYLLVTALSVYQEKMDEAKLDSTYDQNFAFFLTVPIYPYPKDPGGLPILIEV